MSVAFAVCPVYVYQIITYRSSDGACCLKVNYNINTRYTLFDAVQFAYEISATTRAYNNQCTSVCVRVHKFTKENEFKYLFNVLRNLLPVLKYLI